MGAVMTSPGYIKLRARQGTEEVNCRCISYRVNPWGCIDVPVEDAEPLMRVGGFHEASENDLAPYASLSDVESVAWHLPKGKVRSTLLAILRSPNSMNHLVQSLQFS
jgi:hypothetical protein